MGQGTESCGGYDVEYDEYEEGLQTGMWTQRDCSRIHITKMTLQHLTNARRMAERAAERATFEDQADKWNDWVRAFDHEIALRAREVSKADSVNTQPSPEQKATPTVQRGATVTMICHCGCEYEARVADLKRGWALSCSKRCAAIRREFGRPPARRKK